MQSPIAKVHSNRSSIHRAERIVIGATGEFADVDATSGSNDSSAAGISQQRENDQRGENRRICELCHAVRADETARRRQT